MNALQQAIYNKYNASTGHGAYTSVSGRFYLNVAPQNVTFPYVVYFEITDIDDLYFCEELQEHLIQFNCFSQDNSSLEAGQIFENLKSLFDNCSLTVTDWRHIGFQRTLTIPNNDFTQRPFIHGYSIQYDALIERSRPERLNYDAQAGSFTKGNTLTGATSGATATIYGVSDSGTVGTLTFQGITGTFQNDELIYEGVPGSEEYDTIFTNSGFETFTTDVLDITSAVNSFLGANCYYNINLDLAKAYKVAFDFTRNSGADIVYRFAANSTLLSGIVLNETIAGTGTYNFLSLGAAYHGFYIFSGATSFAVSNLSVKEVVNYAIADGTVY